METIAFSILIGAGMYVVYRAATIDNIIPVLAMYTLAFYRFMPSITKIMDMVTYDPSDDNSTKLTLVKFLPDEKGD